MPRNMNSLRHGHRANRGRSKEYRTWLGIKRRCSDKKCKDYPRYGGSGIKVSEEWECSFETFLSDMGSAPTETHQIDRIDPSKGYSKGNCRWVTPAQNLKENKDNLVRVVAFGIEYQNASDACRAYGVKKSTFFYRIAKGLDFETALNPARVQFPRARETYLPRSHPDRS